MNLTKQRLIAILDASNIVTLEDCARVADRIIEAGEERSELSIKLRELRQKRDDIVFQQNMELKGIDQKIEDAIDGVG